MHNLYSRGQKPTRNIQYILTTSTATPGQCGSRHQDLDVLVLGHRHAMIYPHTFVGTLMYIACLCPNPVSVHFYAIPILHFKFPNFLFTCILNHVVTYETMSLYTKPCHLYKTMS